MKALQDHIWPIETVTELDPALSRAVIQDWRGKGIIGGQLESQEGRPDRYLFSGEELIYALTLGWLSRFGILRAYKPSNPKLLIIGLDSAEDLEHLNVDRREVRLTAHKTILQFCRKQRFRVFIAIQATVEEYDFQEGTIFSSLDRRIRKGHTQFWATYHPNPIMKELLTAWSDSTHEYHEIEHGGQRGRAITCIEMERIKNYVVHTLNISDDEDR